VYVAQTHNTLLSSLFVVLLQNFLKGLMVSGLRAWAQRNKWDSNGRTWAKTLTTNYSCHQTQWSRHTVTRYMINFNTIL